MVKKRSPLQPSFADTDLDHSVVPRSKNGLGIAAETHREDVANSGGNGRDLKDTGRSSLGCPKSYATLTSPSFDGSPNRFPFFGSTRNTLPSRAPRTMHSGEMNPGFQTRIWVMMASLFAPAVAATENLSTSDLSNLRCVVSPFSENTSVASNPFERSN